MTSAQPSSRSTTAHDLQAASITEVLLYGLTLDDDDPALGVILNVRRELGLVATLAEQSQHHADFDLGELVPVLESIGRRLDVAIELMNRARRTAPPEASEKTDGVSAS